MTSPTPRSDPRAPNARTPAGAALSDTVLAAKAVTTHGRVPAVQPSLSDIVRGIPVEIQGMWLGITCIVLLVASAAALRLYFRGNVGAVAEVPSGVLAPGGTSSVPAPSGALLPPASPSGSGNPLAIGTGSGVALNSSAFGALAIRDRLPKDVQFRKIGAFIDDLQQLLDIEPSAIDRADVRKLMADAAVASLIPGPNADAERLFTFFTSRAGSAGPDVMFDLMTSRGGTRAATYAEELLRQEPVRARGTPAFRIAYDLKVAP
ncbi:MAG: hypothetical protein R3F14_34280, partial [Polyangiaceae bacterium]